jgi:hypothetical protein
MGVRCRRWAVLTSEQMMLEIEVGSSEAMKEVMGWGWGWSGGGKEG